MTDGTFTELQTLIDNASSGDTITLDKNYTNNGSETYVTINKNININGNNYTVDADNKSRIFSITASTVNIENIELTNGEATQGGAIYVNTSGELNIIESNFTSNTATYSGGAICNFGIITVDTSTNFISNTSRYGGAILNKEVATITNCNFTQNTAISGENTSYGGGIYNDNRLTVKNCIFEENEATTAGGGIYSSTDNVYAEIINSTFTSNIAGTRGGAVYNYNQKAIIGECIFTNNTANYQGAIYKGKCYLCVFSTSSDISNATVVTLNSSLERLGELISTNLTTQGVTASASDGLDTLADKILDI